MFEHQVTVRLHDTDAAGVLYFAHQFRIAHETYEAFMAAAGFGLGDLLRAGATALPIVHAEADYRMPLRVGDKLTVSLRVKRLGRTSFALNYRLTRAGRVVGCVTTAHVAIAGRTGRKKPLPARLRRALRKNGEERRGNGE